MSTIFVAVRFVSPYEADYKADQVVRPSGEADRCRVATRKSRTETVPVKWGQPQLVVSH
jgi:hypothetical protein